MRNFKFRPRFGDMASQTWLIFEKKFGPKFSWACSEGLKVEIQPSTGSSWEIRSNYKLNHTEGVLWRMEGHWPPEYTRPQRKFCENFWRGRLNKYDELGKFLLFWAVEELNMKKLDTQIFEIPFLGWATGLRSRPIFRVFAIFVKFGLPYLGRYLSCPGTIMKNDSQLGVLLNCQRTELYIRNCPRHEWSNFRKSSILDKHASDAILGHV